MPRIQGYNSIVDETFKLNQSPICTEPFSQIVYRNNISITAQLDKVVFSINKMSVDKDKFNSICNISKKYLSCVPHAKYTAIGINPIFFLRRDKNNSPHDYIVNKFINNEIAKKDLLSIGFSLSYNVDENTICSINVSPDKLSEKDNITQGVIIKANFHHSLPDDISKKISVMNTILDSYKNDIHFFESEIISKYF